MTDWKDVIKLKWVEALTALPFIRKLTLESDYPNMQLHALPPVCTCHANGPQGYCLLSVIQVNRLYTPSQSIPGGTCDRTSSCPRRCKTPSTSEKSPAQTSLSAVQSQMPNRNFVVATATQVTIIICFHNSASCFILD